MAVSANYPTPVTVNGFSCKNCTDVDYAKKHIDPAHPKSGPYGINAKTDPTQSKLPTVTFGGALSKLNASVQTTAAATTAAQDSEPGSLLDLSA
jgi:hypothetical protein